MDKQKHIVKDYIDYDLDWKRDQFDEDIKVSKIKEDILKLEELGATHVYISACDSWGVVEYEIAAYKERFETDEEYLKRIQEEKNKEERVAERELQLLKELQNKYKNKV